MACLFRSSETEILHICKKLLSGRHLASVQRKKGIRNKSTGNKTCLYDLHLKHNAKMVDFAGFEMPVVYSDQSISSSHNHTRAHVSLFDVSHMLQTTISGKNCVPFMESLTVADIQGLNENQGTLTLMTNANGGIIDDLIVTKTDAGYLYVVSNAGCTEKDLAHIKKSIENYKTSKKDVELKILADRALIAVQGPGMSSVVQPLVDCDLRDLMFMTSTVATICDVADCRITRCGYTGEDGVEISVPEAKAVDLVETLLSSRNDVVKLAGLAARDSLRLEAGLCLYGNDITDDTTPVEAVLAWTIAKRRRTEANFPGAQIILQQLKDKPKLKRVGLISSGPSPRAHTKIHDLSGNPIGDVTSGCPSPSLGKNIAMGYVPHEFSKAGTKLNYDIRGKAIEAEVVKMPFVQSKYYNKKQE